VNRRQAICGWRVCVVTDARLARGRSHAEVVRAAIAGGADVIQFRDKEASDDVFHAAALELCRICRAHNVPLIINDRVDIACAVGADGVHVGQGDLPAMQARARIGDRMLGVSASTLDEARAACAAGADYLGVGPVFDAQGTKPDARPPIGLAGLAEICAAVELPVMAIGGIHVVNCRQVFAAGATSIAVVSAVVAAVDIARAVRDLKPV
jgi:thiamine-phosphate pyrophosphorylase